MCKYSMLWLHRQDGGNIFSGPGGDTPLMDEGGTEQDTPTQQATDEGRAGQPAMPLEPPGPDRKASDLRNDAAEEERRQKLRQVCSCAQPHALVWAGQPGVGLFLAACLYPLQQCVFPLYQGPCGLQGFPTNGGRAHCGWQSSSVHALPGVGRRKMFCWQ